MGFIGCPVWVGLETEFRAATEEEQLTHDPVEDIRVLDLEAVTATQEPWPCVDPVHICLAIGRLGANLDRERHKLDNWYLGDAHIVFGGARIVQYLIETRSGIVRALGCRYSSSQDTG